MWPFYLFFVVLSSLLGACTNSEQQSSYEISQTQWSGQGQELEGPLILKFNFITGTIGYGITPPYTRSLPYSYSPKNYQGSIFIDNFPFDTGKKLNVTWLFSISNDTKTMTLVLFRMRDEKRITVILQRQ